VTTVRRRRRWSLGANVFSERAERGTQPVRRMATVDGTTSRGGGGGARVRTDGAYSIFFNVKTGRFVRLGTRANMVLCIRPSFLIFFLFACLTELQFKKTALELQIHATPLQSSSTVDLKSI
jgi:hypothetical protein